VENYWGKETYFLPSSRSLTEILLAVDECCGCEDGDDSCWSQQMASQDWKWRRLPRGSIKFLESHILSSIPTSSPHIMQSKLYSNKLPGLLKYQRSIVNAILVFDIHLMLMQCYLK